MKAWNKFCCTLTSLVLLMGSLAAPAFAYGAETEPAPNPDPASAPVTVPAAEPAEEDALVTVQEEVTGPLTPEGNLTLVDDYHTTYSDGSGQQFITLVSKSGAYFYLVIDRAADGDETVHFMNLVDEADLLALMDEEDIPQPEPEPEPDPEPEPEPMPEPEPEKEEGGAGKFMLALLVLAGIAGGGGYFWMKMQQKKREAEENKPDPDADYREDEEEIILPDGEPEPDAAQDEEAERKAYQTSDGYEDV